MQAISNVLLYGRDRQLLKTREWILETIGVRSQVADNVHDFLSALQHHRFALAILCHSVSPADQEDAVAAVHRLQPGMRILILIAEPIERQSNPSERTLDTHEGPGKLLQAVEKMLANSAALEPGDPSCSKNPQIMHLPVDPAS